tara:strand:- start:366 stop:683 length:318 start_codon:yes stop_codon:yes gene_type:complete
MENDFYVDAINSLLPDAKFHGSSGGVLASDNSIVEWFDERTEPTVSAIQTEMTRLEAEYDAQLYARNRASEYPSLLELTVALYDTDDKSAVEAKRASVKAKYPKP